MMRNGFPPARWTYRIPDTNSDVWGFARRSGMDGAPFASRWWLCVNRVAGRSRRTGLDVVDHSVRTTHSAKGATARPHVNAVSDS